MFNFYQETPSGVRSHGAETTGASNTNFNENKTKSSSHSTIANDTYNRVVSLILDALWNNERNKTDENRK